MNWFYARDGQQIGPVDEGELDGLVQRGEIIASTLVWRSGQAAWQPYTEVRPLGGPVAPAERPAPPRAPVGEGEARCAECDRVFPEDEVVRLGGVPVCAACKPILLQKLREGVPLQGRLPYAGFWIRWAAVFFDGLILLPITVLVWGGAFYLHPQIFTNNGGYSLLQFVLQIFMAGVSAGYEIFFVGRYAATPGKMICNLRVVRSDGAPITYARATGRHFSKWLSQLILCIGYLMAAFDDQKRSLHDHICDTRVVYKER